MIWGYFPLTSHIFQPNLNRGREYQRKCNKREVRPPTEGDMINQIPLVAMLGGQLPFRKKEVISMRAFAT
ncbi:MAG: hypothetical protein CVU68_04420 [Deltaproteobacteria bacterium HGW-Deltaproteobacteria-3]|jgi:hypothetical protein|nr:MAG: hypothetical protein CVU68_04420 [Deltaproteobacteria bacterium HGW-Deltaproteobacteria-3]